MNGSASISIATWSKYYTRSRQAVEKEIANGPPPPLASGPLEIEKSNVEPTIWPHSKGVLRKSSYNPNASATQHYSIVDDLAQAPSTMSTLEVLQSYLSQRKALLSAIIEIDPVDSSLLTFDLENFVPRLPHQILLVIQVGINGLNIHRDVVDEGASTCVMSSTCWKAIGSPTLSSSPNAL